MHQTAHISRGFLIQQISPASSDLLDEQNFYTLWTVLGHPMDVEFEEEEYLLEPETAREVPAAEAKKERIRALTTKVKALTAKAKNIPVETAADSSMLPLLGVAALVAVVAYS